MVGREKKGKIKGVCEETIIKECFQFQYVGDNLFVTMPIRSSYGGCLVLGVTGIGEKRFRVSDGLLAAETNGVYRFKEEDDEEEEKGKLDRRALRVFIKKAAYCADEFEVLLDDETGEIYDEVDSHLLGVSLRDVASAVIRICGGNF